MKHSNDKILIIGGDSTNISKYGISTFSLYRSISFLFKPLRLFSLRTGLFLKLWQNRITKRTVANFDTIILFDCYEMFKLVERIEQTADKNCRLILFFWNPLLIYDQFSINHLSKKWEIWSFDYSDCKTFNFKYSGQFVFDKCIPLQSEINIDIFFIGIDKGRFKYLLPLETSLKEHGLTIDFRLVDNKLAMKDRRFSHAMSYSDSLHLASSSVCLLEYNQKSQFGLTLRAIEAITMDKKLVTNNKDIVRYDFYDPSRILVVDFEKELDCSSKIITFLSTGMKPYSKFIKERYKFNSWLTRLLANVEQCDII